MKPLARIFIEADTAMSGVVPISSQVPRERAEPTTPVMFFRFVDQIGSVIPAVLIQLQADGAKQAFLTWIDLEREKRGFPVDVINEPPWWLYAAVQAAERASEPITKHGKTSHVLAQFSAEAPELFRKKMDESVNRLPSSLADMVLALSCGEWESERLTVKQKIDALALAGVERKPLKPSEYSAAWQRLEQRIKRMKRRARLE